VETNILEEYNVFICRVEVGGVWTHRIRKGWGRGYMSLGRRVGTAGQGAL
jgi:hypothetical protein